MRKNFLAFLLPVSIFLILAGCKKSSNGNNTPGGTNGTGQHVSSTKEYAWKSGQWKPIGASAFTYNNDCQKVLETDANLDTTTGQSKGDTSKHLLTYNTNGTLHDHTIQFVDKGTGNWVNSFRVSYGYLNNTDSPSTEVTASWKNNQWQSVDSTVNTYDNSGHKISAVEWFNNTSSSSWTKGPQTTISYTGSGRISQILILYSIEVSGITIGEDQRETSSYDTNGNLSTVLFEASTSTPDNWIKAGQESCTYTADGLLAEVIFQSANPISGVWMNNAKIDYSYTNSCQ